jgi:hypothetical protein
MVRLEHRDIDHFVQDCEIGSSKLYMFSIELHSPYLTPSAVWKKRMTKVSWQSLSHGMVPEMTIKIVRKIEKLVSQEKIFH